MRISQKRSRRVSSRIDDHPEIAATIQFQPYYRKWMCEVLDSLIRDYRENMEQCLEKLKPLAEILQPPLTELTREHLESVSKLFPPSVPDDPEYLYAEFSVFENILNSENKSCKTVHDVADVAYRNKSILPAVYKCFKLLLTAPVTVAKTERTFSKMKVIKNFSLRSTMSGERLEGFIVLAAEKNLTDKMDLNVVLRRGLQRKTESCP